MIAVSTIEALGGYCKTKTPAADVRRGGFLSMTLLDFYDENRADLFQGDESRLLAGSMFRLFLQVVLGDDFPELCDASFEGSPMLQPLDDAGSLERV